MTALGLKLAVVPAGRPLALRAMLCAVPLVTAVVTVAVPLPPSAMLRPVGLTLREKSLATAVTVSVNVVLWLVLAPAPVMVTVNVPVGVEPPVLVVMVDEAPALTVLGLKLAVAPLGRPLALSEIVCAAPLVTAVMMVAAPVAPWATVRLVGFTVTEKSFAAAGTVSVRVVLCVVLAPLPVMVTLYVPAGVAVPAVIVSMDDAPAVIVLGLKPAVAPVGKPVAVSVTLCAEPLVTALLTVAEPLLPCCTVRLAGLTASEKSLLTGRRSWRA